MATRRGSRAFPSPGLVKLLPVVVR